IFADAGRIALDVPRIERCTVEGRSEEQSQPGLTPDQLIFHSGHGALSAGGIGCPRHHAPGLGNGVDPAFVARRRAQRSSAIEITTPVPVAIPPVSFKGTLQRRGVRAPYRGARSLLASFRQRREGCQRRIQEPTWPGTT